MENRIIRTFNNRLMMMIGLSFVICHLSLGTATAQTFTQRVQKHVEGEGTVTIHHDQAIDKLVNGEDSVPAKPKKPATPATKPSRPAEPAQKKRDEASHQAQSQNDTPRQQSDSIAMGPRRTYKTTGYRVQVFAGGNTRRDRQRAEHTGNSLRQLFPGEEVYVHFYSPRWICRLGNYLTYQEAHDRMLEVRKLGYESATVVKGKITVTR